jgi:hypothetical protein
VKLALTVVLVAIAIAVAACGSGSKHYRAAEVRNCLADAKLSLIPADLPGDVSPDGTEGDLAVRVAGEEVHLAFGKDAGEARDNAAKQNALASGALGRSAADYVRTKGNVAYWVTSTDAGAFDPVERCLK